MNQFVTRQKITVNRCGPFADEIKSTDHVLGKYSEVQLKLI